MPFDAAEAMKASVFRYVVAFKAGKLYFDSTGLLRLEGLWRHSKNGVMERRRETESTGVLGGQRVRPASGLGLERWHHKIS